MGQQDAIHAEMACLHHHEVAWPPLMNGRVIQNHTDVAARALEFKVYTSHEANEKNTNRRFFDENDTRLLP